MGIRFHVVMLLLKLVYYVVDVRPTKAYLSC